MEKKTSSTEIKTEPLILDDQSQEKTAETSVIERFFKVMTPDFHTILRLPPAFCKKLKAGSSTTPDRAVLTSRKGTWSVKIGECVNGQICFEDEWSEFAEAHELEIGDFVLFEHQCNMEFNVFVYDSSCCENDFSLPDMEKEKTEKEKVEENDLSTEAEAAAKANAEEEEEEEEEEAAASEYGREIYERANRKIRRGRPRNMHSMSLQERRQFTVKFPKRSLVDIPKAFWRLNKLEGCLPTALLTGPSGESFEATLTWTLSNTLRFNRCRGWDEFCESNGLKAGDICTFQLSCGPSTSNSPIKLNVQVIRAPNL